MKTFKNHPSHFYLDEMKVSKFFIIAVMLTISNIGFAQWSLSGNSISSTDFIGTTNNEDLFFTQIIRNVWP